MASLGSGRKESLGFIENLTPSEKMVLECLLDWDYLSMRANSFSISNKINISQASVGKALHYLNYRGVVLKSAGRSWFINPKIKDQLRTGADQKVDQPLIAEQQSLQTPDT